MVKQHLLRHLEENIGISGLVVASLLLFLFLAMSTLGHAFELQKIPSPYEIETSNFAVEKFKSLPPEKQQQLLREYEKQPPDERDEIVSEERRLKLRLRKPLPLSDFEIYVAGRLSPEISREVRPFGYDLFEKPPSTFAPSKTAPVTLDYVIGPSDEMQINLWGKVEKQFTVIVDREGNITLPSVGVVNVAGLTFRELKSYLKRKFSSYFSDFHINVTLGSLRTIKIFVVGKAATPGSYDISGLSSLINALFASGGPSKIGSMRRIQVVRDSHLLTELDLYDFILKGDKSKDVALQPNDVIFIPNVGALVAIVGNVRAPAIYELKGETRILDALAMAGGITATGYLHKVQVERIVDNRFKSVIDKNLADIKEQQNMLLEDGDIIKVFPISEKIVNAVNLRGNILKPGLHEWHKGTKVSDIVKQENLARDTLYDFARIERRPPPYHEIQLIHFKLDKALSKDPQEDIILQPFDVITIYNKWELKTKPVVRISGAVNMYEEPEDELAEELWGVKKDRAEDRAKEFYQDELWGAKKDRAKESYQDELWGAKKDRAKESYQDELWDAEKDRAKEAYQDELRDAEKDRAKEAYQEYRYIKGMKLSDLIKLAGGLKRYAYNKAELTRVHITLDGPVVEQRTLDISKMSDDTLKDDLVLEPDDFILIKTIPGWELYRQVTVRGEVRFPGKYAVKHGERLADLLERAGGFTKNAYLKGTVFTRKSIQKDQQQKLDDSIDRLEHNILSASASQTAASYSAEEASILSQQTAQYQKLIEKMRSVKALGRLVIQMVPLNVLSQTVGNIELEDGDVIHVPAHLSTINVMGAVYNPSSYIYNPKVKIDTYIDIAGGGSENADTDKVYVIKADGSALSPAKIKGGLFQWDTKQYRWAVGGLSKTKTKLDPGDTIIVPEKFDRLAIMRNIKDITQIIFQMALTAGVFLAI